MPDHITIPDLVTPRRAIHFLEVCTDANKNNETFFRLPPGTSPIDTRTIIRHGERELDKHRLSVANGLAHPHDRPFQVLGVRSPADSTTTFDAVVEEPKTHRVLFDPLSDILCLRFPSTTNTSVPSGSRSTTVSPVRPIPKRRPKPPPWTINNLFLDVDLTPPTDFSHYSRYSRTPSLAFSISTLADPTPLVTPTSPFFPTSPSTLAASVEPEASASSDSGRTIVPRRLTPSTPQDPASYIPQMTTATETLQTITRVAIPYEASFGDTFQCVHCYETYALEVSYGDGNVSDECWPWRDQQRKEGHEFRVVVGAMLEGLLSRCLPAVEELWLVAGVEAEGVDVASAAGGGVVTMEGGPAFHGLDARFAEVGEGRGERGGVVAEMVGFAEEVERLMRTGGGWRHEGREGRCRVMVPIAYAAGIGGGFGASGAEGRGEPL